MDKTVEHFFGGRAVMAILQRDYDHLPTTFSPFDKEVVELLQDRFGSDVMSGVTPTAV